MPSSIFPVHRYIFSKLAEELIKRNHDVYWFEYGLKEPITLLPNGVKETYIKLTIDDNNILENYYYENSTYLKDIWKEENNNDGEQTSAWLASIKMCENLLQNHKKIYNELVNKKFDSVIVDDLYNPCGLLLTGLQKSVYIYWSITSLRSESAWAHHSPSPPSYLPVRGTKLSDNLNFIKRNYNLLFYIRSLYIHQHIILRKMDKLFNKFYPGQVTDAFLMERNASINFINTPPIYDFARPYMPRVNFVGGLHCHKPKPLSNEFESFIQQKDNFIVISGGFSTNWKYASEKQKKIIIKVIEKLNNINFIWQYNGMEIKNLPNNVIVKEWLPLQDLLGHKSCILHISHGGLNSLIESVYHGIPVLGIPLTTFSYDNILRITERKAGLMIEKHQWNTKNFINAINKITQSPSFKEEMSLFQDMVVDTPYTELEHASFWVEFIVRHQEVPHARSGADKLNVLQYFMIDVIIFLFSITLISGVITYYILRFILKIIIKVIGVLFLRSSSGNKK
ncbi:UDP-glucuronosyl/UDP-glucosyltransferase family-containing protein [Strongyloides ratti]|uniref:glucuronosyltransferase n=1 Tax=Strongyloides ratti TaxID=34506 RepID=A0A090KZU9_STRRB|nr:UDP-glucuronosyl/UDP-glucosyltransferase family-containing protein [Strongyloides ratti]CEF60714.1 UDP-glucuronosyl/UDP-glucosyltransferase family-containing protein [Strongyloides ratti]